MVNRLRGRIGQFMGIDVVASDDIQPIGVDGDIANAISRRGEEMERYYGTFTTERLNIAHALMGDSSFLSGEDYENDKENNVKSFFKMVDSKINKQDRINLVNKIVKEISDNKDFRDCFMDIKAEVCKWSDIKLNNWK